MTLWRQRVVKFFAKIFGVLIISCIVAFFLFYYYFFKKDNLIKYVPPEAVAYMTLKLDSNILDHPLLTKIVNKFQTDNNLPVIDEQALNQLINYNSVLAIMPNVSNHNIYFDYLLLFDLKFNGHLSREYLDYFSNINWSTRLIEVNALGKKILVASNSADLLDRVNKIASQQESSLVQNVNVVYNLRKISDNSWAKIYINIDQLAKEVSQTENLSWKLFLASLIIQDNNQLYLGLNSEPDKIVIQTANFKAEDQINWLFKKVPNDLNFSLNLSAYPHKIAEFNELLSIIDKQAAGQVQTNKQYFESVYNIDFDNDVMPILPSLVQVMVDQQNDWFVSLDFQQAANKEQFITDIEQLIIKYLSTKYPVEVQKVMPDQTRITQVVKDNKIHFEDENLSNLSLKTIKYSNSSLSYYIIGDWLILANNKEKLTKLIISNNEKEYIDQTTAFQGHNNIMVNASYFLKYLPNLGEITRLIINDSLEGDKGFRLILE
jgi:hypothetical protein